MLAYFAKRLLAFVPLALGMIIVTFALMLIVPGDPAAVFLGQDAAPDAIARLRETLGLNDPWHVRLGAYILNVLKGDLGQSIFQNQSIASLIAGRLGATVELAFAALFFAIVIGAALGILAATQRGSLVDVGAMMIAQAGVSMPVFWLGILLTLAFAVQLGWLPSVGRGEPLPSAFAAALAGRPAALMDSLAHLLLPAVALGAGAAAIISRLVRASMLEVLNADFIRTAYAKGVPKKSVILRHALRNALLPIVSVIGLRFGALLGGAVLTESIFAWPGIGQLTITAISQRDLPLVQGVVLVFALMFAFVNLIVDLLYVVIDPRVRLK